MKASEYRDLIQSFLKGYFRNAEEFARLYDKTFLSETGDMSEELYAILGDFWVDIEAYSPLWDPEDIDQSHITEQTLVAEAEDALRKLDIYLKRHTKS